MKKTGALLLGFILALSLISLAYANDNNSGTGSNSQIRSETRTKTITVENGTKTITEERERTRNGETEIMIRTRIITQSEREEKLREFKERLIKQRGKIKVEGRNVTIRELSNEQKEILAGKINAKTGLNLTADDIGNGTLGSILRAYLSNGRFALVKVMPDRASETALKRLRAKCAERNCTVELKEVGSGNNTRAAYEVRTEKDSRVLFIFKKKMHVTARVDAETGEIIEAKKPWWAFLAKEKNADDKEIEQEVEAGSQTPETTSSNIQVTAST